jgi:colanic acid/amylovoran biosynthesis protein
MRAVREAVTWLIRTREAEVTFLSTCQGLPQYWTDDSRIATEIAEGLPDDVRHKVTVRRDYVPPHVLQEEFAGFDLVLATRMHAAILALNAGTPVVAIAYEFKTIELFRSLGVPELAHDIETLSGHRLIDSLAACLDDLPHIRTHVGGVVKNWQLDAQRLGDYVVKAAGGHDGDHLRPVLPVIDPTSADAPPASQPALPTDGGSQA